MNVLRHCEREIVRALAATGSTQSQVTHADRFEIATDNVVVKVWTVDAYERERGAVSATATIAEELRALGQEWREEWPDGRVCKSSLNKIADRLDEARRPGQ